MCGTLYDTTRDVMQPCLVHLHGISLVPAESCGGVIAGVHCGCGGPGRAGVLRNQRDGTRVDQMGLRRLFSPVACGAAVQELP